MLGRLDIAAAKRELQTKSPSDIEKETAYKWCSRALASVLLLKEAKTSKEALSWRLKAEDFRHEAIEHAALVEDDCKTVKKLTRVMQEAWATIPGPKT